MKEMSRKELKEKLSTWFKAYKNNMEGRGEEEELVDKLLEWFRGHENNMNELGEAIDYLALNQIIELIKGRPRATRALAEKLIDAVIDPLDDYDLPEEQRLYMQITDEIRDNVKQLLIEAGMEAEKK